jgi:hypothetical protein
MPLGSKKDTAEEIIGKLTQAWLPTRRPRSL